ncbi:type VII secretion-associated serine protease mycosin [Streptomyces sp. NPDC056987]|uniref:type VII secretion-associated serine protease mycosin n=1 Tax=Streptomyces sp. NPDC056987 TaxID=3345988 RepID=UPI003640787D
MFISSRSAVRNARVLSATLGMLLVGIAATPSHAETIRERQWHLDAMKADEMWRTSTGKGVTVAVLDSGVDKSLPDLEGQVLPGIDLATDQSGDETSDPVGHGTSMASLIAGTGKRAGGKGAFGLAPGAKILPVRLPRKDEGTKLSVNVGLWTGALSTAIRYAADEGAKVINLSQGSTVTGENVTSAVKYALGKGSLVFAAVGNSAEDGNLVIYPAATPGVVGVAAVGRDIRRTEESQHGPQVDLAAPGEDMFSACAGGSELCNSHGTSDATALASASAALIWSKYPEWTNNQVLRVMLNTAGKAKSGDVRTDFGGYGVVRPRIALKTPGDPGPADEYPLPDLAAAEPSESPSPEASATSGSAKEDKEDTEQPASAAPSDGGGNTGLWIGLGVGAAALLGGAIAVPVVRSRRRAAAVAVAPAPAYAPYPHQQPPAYPPAYGPPQPGQGYGDPRHAPPGPGI